MQLRSISDKKGITISTPTIIITILAILVLLIVALSFTGAMATLVNKIKMFLGIAISLEAEKDQARQQCELWCIADREESFCNGVYKVSINKDEAIWLGCNHLPDTSGVTSARGEDLGVSCSEFTC